MPAYFWARGGAVEPSTGISWNIYTGNVFDPHGAGLGTVALPQLKPVGAVVGGEVERVVRDGETERTAAARPGIDVLDAYGAGLGAVALPQLEPARAVECGEVDGAVEDGKAAGDAAVRPGIDVLDANGAGRGAVALPQLESARTVECGEVDGVVEDGAAEGPIAARHGIDPVHPHAAGREERREDDEAQAQEGIAQCICRCHRLTSLVVGRVETQ